MWKDFLTIVRDEQGSRVVETWLKAVILEQWDVACKTVYIKAPNAFVKDWIQGNYIHLFKQHLSRLLNVDQINIIFLQTGQKVEATSEKKIAFMPALVANREQASIEGAPSSPYQTGSLIKPLMRGRARVNTHYLFSNFIVGPHNSLAFAAANAVIERPGQIYNPLFIYGRSGLGKTHLLHAIGNEISNKYPKAVVLYQTADRFVNEFINAIRFDKTHNFKEKYKDVDVLLIDDIQFISNKDQTQEAFFHIFNSLFESQKQIIFSSDSFPQDIKGIAERLRSRLECGLVTDISMPSLETKMAILKKKAEFNNEQLTDEVAQFIAERVRSNIRELEGSLIRVMAFATLTGNQISLDLAQKVLLRDSALRSNKKDIKLISLEQIADIVGKSYAYTIKDLQSPSRSKKVSLARQVAMYLMKDVTSNPLSDIARFFNKKDHSTVVHAIQKIQQLTLVDQSFKQRLQYIKSELLQR
ncbi:hypothetical protein A3F06_00910 [candidate division TM6 bacterium RIFCSPHIGHO2_12_FULL_36_22]|nr:MAG: hypothetical protein A3F06_00910 [candidate division TM6 bacterium RIFCSPHIGHO2_12_FULL_36_22]